MKQQLDVFVDVPAEVVAHLPGICDGAEQAQYLRLLRGALARADHQPGAASLLPGLMDEYALHAEGAALPLAAFSRLGEAGADKDASLVGPGLQWWRADPVHLAAGRDELRLLGTRHLRLTEPESRQLGQSIAAHFAGDGIRMFVASAERWYLGFAEPLDCLASAPGPLDGRNIWPGLPVGPDALRLRALVNEVQMLLHEHPVNQAREARGERVINSVWAWGGGVLPPAQPARALGTLLSDDPVLRGVWAHADPQAVVLSAEPEAALAPLLNLDRVSVGAVAGAGGGTDRGHDPARPSVLWLDARQLSSEGDAAGGHAHLSDAALAMRIFQDTWFTAMYQALGTGALARLRVFFAGHVFLLNPRNRWRVWRRPSALPALPGLPRPTSSPR